MSLDQELLKLIQKAIVQHGGDLGGMTKFDGDRLQIFDGRVTLRTTVETYPEMGDIKLVHSHVLATLHGFDDEVLDACVTGLGVDDDAALSQSVAKWVTGIAGPIRSFIDDNPVCMTCKSGVQGGDADAGFSPESYGFERINAFVGPSFQTSFKNDDQNKVANETLPWFQYASESASGRKVHLAKVTLEALGEEGWKRHLEVDGHEISHVQHDWLTDVPAPEIGSIVRYAVFAFPDDSDMSRSRAQLDQAIEAFIRIMINLKEGDEPVQKMFELGFEHDVVDQVDTISTMAFGRMFFEGKGVQYQPDVIRIRKDGTHEILVPLMSLPAYNRGRAVLARLAEEMSNEKQQQICLYGNESSYIYQLLADGTDVDTIELPHWLVAELGCSDDQVEAGMALRNELYARTQFSDFTKPTKSWWQFWK